MHGAAACGWGGPLITMSHQVRFAWGGDISGQNVCRDAAEGFPVMEALNNVEGKDFFLNLGDAIYGERSLLVSGSVLIAQHTVPPCFAVIGRFGAVAPRVSRSDVTIACL